ASERSLKKIFKIRTVASTYAIYNFQKSSLFSKITSFTLSSFDKILALAQPSTKELIKIGIDNNKISTYYLWVDDTKFKAHPKSKARQILNLPNKFTAIFVGRLIPIKGIKIIIKLISIFPNIHFIVIGDHGPLKEKLEKKAIKFPNITFYAGKINPKKLSLYYSSADLLLFPSLYNEAFGKVAIESLFCGTPVLASNKGAIPDVINNKVGKIIPPTLKNFKQELSFFYKNPNQLKKLTKNCLKYAKNNFSIKNAQTIENTYY
ncbi:glycosyltransferase family 4 protein, partial [Patescibacteria group bacterium]|nr:glycosyltransferase family 4 protein [Patescibacteria group bacterium]